MEGFTLLQGISILSKRVEQTGEAIRFRPRQFAAYLEFEKHGFKVEIFDL